MEIAIVENLQREDLNPIEEAEAYRRLIDEFGLKQDEAAQKVSKSRTAVTNALRLLKLDERVQKMVIDDMISGGHARALLAIEDKEEQYGICLLYTSTRIRNKGTGVDKLERNTEKFEKALSQLDIQLSDEQIHQFMVYYEMLVETNKAVSYTHLDVYKRQEFCFTANNFHVKNQPFSAFRILCE